MTASAPTLVFDCFVHDLFVLHICDFKACLHYLWWATTCFDVRLKCIACYKPQILFCMCISSSCLLVLNGYSCIGALHYYISVIFYQIQQWHWHFSLQQREKIFILILGRPISLGNCRIHDVRNDMLFFKFTSIVYLYLYFFKARGTSWMLFPVKRTQSETVVK